MLGDYCYRSVLGVGFGRWVRQIRGKFTTLCLEPSQGPLTSYDLVRTCWQIQINVRSQNSTHELVDAQSEQSSVTSSGRGFNVPCWRRVWSFGSRGGCLTWRNSGARTDDNVNVIYTFIARVHLLQFPCEVRLLGVERIDVTSASDRYLRYGRRQRFPGS